MECSKSFPPSPDWVSLQVQLFQHWEVKIQCLLEGLSPFLINDLSRILNKLLGFYCLGLCLMLGCYYVSIGFRLAHNKCGWAISNPGLYFLKRYSFGLNLFGIRLVDKFCLRSNLNIWAHDYAFGLRFSQVLRDGPWAWKSLNKFLELLQLIIWVVFLDCKIFQELELRSRAICSKNKFIID